MKRNAELPVGQEQSLRVLAASMQRNVLLAGPALGVVIVAGAAVVAGLAGAWSAAIGVVIGIGSALFTLWQMRRTAHREPRVVMMASLGGFVQKMIILLVALFGAGSIPGVHRMSLAVALLLMLIGVTAAEGWAGYRFRSAIIDPDDAPDAAPTSATVTGLSASPDGHGAAAARPVDGTGSGPDHDR